MKRFSIYIIAAITGLLVFASCDNPVSLGKKLGMDGPRLTITSPAPATGQTDIAVGDLFNLSGTARGDDAEVDLLEVKMTVFQGDSQQDTGREWRWKDGGWWYKADSFAPWKPYGEADYGDSDDPEKPVDPSSWRKKDKDTVDFNLPMLMKGNTMPSPADYYITVTATDSVGRSDANSIAKIKVKYDNGEPNLEVKQPGLLRGYYTGGPGGSLMYPDDYPRNQEGNYIFDTYIYDPVNEPEKTYNYIRYWVTQPVDFRWEIDKDMIGEYMLSFEFTNKHNLLNPGAGEAKQLYYRYEWDETNIGGFLPKRGIFTDLPDDQLPNLYRRIRGALTNDDIKLRDTVTGNPISGTLPKPSGTYTPIQVVSWLTDGAGNMAYRANGWFAYFPEADKPFALIDFGKTYDPAGEIPNNAPLLSAPLWSGQETSRKQSNYAYDNTGVKSLKWTLYKLIDGTLYIDSAVGPWTKEITDNDFLSGGTYPYRRRWEFYPDTAYGVGTYRIEVTVTDINGLVGDPQVAFFTIENNSTPTLKGGELQSPSKTLTLWGDGSGNFDIKGTAQIQDSDDTPGVNAIGVNRVSIVWINPKLDTQTAINSRVKYMDKNSGDWEEYANNPGAYPKGYYQDENGNRVWEVAKEKITFVAATDGNSSSNGMEDYDFIKTLNIFTDLDIGPGKNPHADQEFLIRVWSQGATIPRSSVSTFTTRGKTNPPVLTVEKITIKRKAGPTDVYTKPFPLIPRIIGDKQKTDAGGNPVFENGNPVIDEIGDIVTIDGTWRDDSWTNWSGIPVDTRHSFLTGFDVIWNGAIIKEKSLKGDFYNDGTWKSGELRFLGDNEDAYVTINAVLTDLNGNKGKVGDSTSTGETIVIATSLPTLYRITSDVSDGSYGEYKETYPGTGFNYIDIFLAFNGSVYFYEPIEQEWPPAGKTAPYLELNNGGRAFYNRGNGGDSLVFRYYIDGKIPPNLPAYVGEKDWGGGSSPGNLDVKQIVWNNYSPTDVKSRTDNTPAIIKDFDSSNPDSLAGGKNIVIDKDPPKAVQISTNAQEARPYGLGNSVYITLTFDEAVTVSATGGNFYLNLSGGNLAANNATAAYSGFGTKTVSFVYTVTAGHDTTAAGFTGSQQYLNVQSIYTGTGLSIKDLAGNEIVKPISTIPPPPQPSPSGSNLGRAIRIDTIKPATPGVSSIPQNNYEQITFYITGIETGATAEYNLNYDSAKPTEGWMTVSDTDRTNGITLSRSGEYNIAARQSDNAVPPNVSDISTPRHFFIDTSPLLSRISSSTADGIYGYKAESPGQVISIDLYSRIPLTITGTPSLVLNVQNAGAQNSAALRTGQTGQLTKWTFDYTIPNAQVNTLNNTEKLNVTSLSLNSATFTDSAGINVTSYIDLTKIVNTNQLNSQKNIVIQAGYPEVTRRTTIGTGTTANTDLQFTSNADASESTLKITFNRDIYPGDTTSQLVIKQIATDYRIPTVMTVERYDALFNNRTDIWDAVGSWAATDVPAAWGANNAAKAAYWQALGAQLYQKGSNGADSNYASDTSVKYVLDYSVNPLAADTTAYFGTTLVNIKNAMRAAEALRFNTRDKEVTISTDKRTMTITLSGDKALPVKRATYQWNFPNGFVKDILGKPNGTSTTGYDTNLVSGNPETAGNDSNALRLPLTGNYENPVVRINKGTDTETFTGSGADRQAIQPLQTAFRVDGRSPGTTFQYRRRWTTDNVGQLLWRNGAKGNAASYNETPTQYTYTIGGGATDTTTTGGTLAAPTGNNGTVNGIAPWALPNVGNQRETDLTSYNAAKNRPQSGNSSNPYTEPGTRNVTSAGGGFDATWNGMNHWSPISSATWENWSAYNNASPVTIGDDNYNSGGMIIHINARINGQTAYQAYEAAYRSVFVFNNTTINGNGVSQRRGNNWAGYQSSNTYLLNIGYDGASYDLTAILPNPQLGRMWIRGGDTIGGDTSIPDFPIARDRTLSKKARLMTPIAATTGAAGGTGDFATSRQGSNWDWSVNNSNIPASYTQTVTFTGTNTTSDKAQYPGEYLWFWVTWRINVYAYIDPFCGELPTSTTASQVPQNYKELYKGIVPSKEHYPLIPGRTTVFETRRVNRMRYGGQGGMTDFGPLLTSPMPSD